MATVKNDWIGYLDRSYQQIKASLLARVTSSNPELTDHTESNVFIIIISMFSGIAEMIGFYIDQFAQEAYLATALRTTSVIKHSRGYDYRIKTRNPETVDLVVTFTGTCTALSIIGAGTAITSTVDGILYVTKEDVTVHNGDTGITLPISQSELVVNPSFALTTGLANQTISLGINYAHKTLQLVIGGVDYEEVDTFAFSPPTATNYIVEVLEDGNAYIVLGNGVNAIKPTVAQTIEATYFTTLGPDGRVAADGFDKATLTLIGTITGITGITSTTNLVNSSGGKFYEGIEDIRKNAPLSLRTQDRMCSRRDHKDIMELVNGVAKAEVSFCCGKTINLYIAPSGGGVPSSLLLAEAQAEADIKKMVATFPDVRPAGETRLVLGANVTAKKRKSLTTTSSNVKAALVEFGSIDNQDINGAIRLSDLQALIDNLTEVDFVDITKMYTKPYARPVSHINGLNWTNVTTSVSSTKIRWRLEYDGTNFRVFKNDEFQVSLPLGDEYNDSTVSGFKFTILASTYDAGNSWVFTTYPYLQNLKLDDFTLFTILESDLDITVLAQPNTTENVCS